MMHCEPIIFEGDFYKASPKEHELLAKVILDALNDNDSCVQFLAVKNFFIFDNLSQVQEKKIYKDISRKIEKIVGRPVNDVKGHLSAYAFQSYQQYCGIVEKEINGLIEGDKFSCYGRGECKPVNFSHPEEKTQKIIEQKKAQKIIEPPKKTEPCPEKSASGLILKIKKDTLNLRSEPNTRCKIVGELTKNDLLYVIKKEGEWFYISTEKCKKGWVAGYLTKDAKSE